MLPHHLQSKGMTVSYASKKKSLSNRSRAPGSYFYVSQLGTLGSNNERESAYVHKVAAPATRLGSTNKTKSSEASSRQSLVPSTRFLRSDQTCREALEVFRRTNRERSNSGRLEKRPLSWNEELARQAEEACKSLFKSCKAEIPYNGFDNLNAVRV